MLNIVVKLACTHLMYFFINYIPKEKYYVVPTLFIDDAISYNTYFAPIYISWYAMVIYSFYQLREDRSYHFKNVLLICCISYLIFLICPTTVIRPEFISNNSLWDKMLLLIQKIDNPVNCVPSLHASVTTYLWISIFKKNTSNTYFKQVISLWSIAILFSCLALKQHLAIDLFFGIILAYTIYVLSEVIHRKSIELVVQT